MKISTTTQFYQDLISEEKQINFNGKSMALGYYNLVLSIRDCKLYAVGMKPNRHWKISDVKKYFGVKGTATQIKDQLEEIKQLLIQG